jgi:uncharacterized protein (TIGR00255 family)
MSGHGRGESSDGATACTVECASVNRKGIEVAVTLPRGLAVLEPRIREIVQGRFSRGRITVSVLVEFGSEMPGDACLDLEAARKRLVEFEQARRTLGLPDPVTFAMLVGLPGVIRHAESEAIDPETVWKPVLHALELSMGGLSEMRLAEGRHLGSDLRKRIRILEAAMRFIRRRVPAVAKVRRELMIARLREGGVTIAVDDASLIRELALLAERADITEELTRIESHLAQFLAALDAGGPVGRSLDYLAQELFREFNTLGNKAGDAAISQRVVQSKAELDRIREQVANLE